jgi:glycogen synthase
MEPPFLFEPGPLNDEILRNRLSGKRYLLFFGAVGLLKGVAVIAEIIDELLCQYEGLFFVLIGQDKGYRGRPMMEHLWNRAGQNRQRVLHLGVIPHPCLYPILQNAHAVVLPSLIDNLPNTCLEAMALRRVVIGTRGASFEQLIEDGRSGFLAEKNSGPSLLEKIREAMALDDFARKAMGDCARERILKLSPERAATELIAFLERVSRRPFIPCGGCEAK